MSGSSGRRKSRRRQLRASHQKNWLIGRHAVLETLRAGRWPVDELYVAADIEPLLNREVTELSATAGIRPQSAPAERLTELSGADHHQGLIARMGLYPYDTVEHVLTNRMQVRSDPARPSLVVVCDRIQDSFNFGAILRCCDAMAADAVVIGESGQSPVTPQVARSSAGAVNHLSVVLTENLVDAVERFRSCGLVIAAASEKSETSCQAVDLNRPLALLLGSEARGIREELLEKCDLGLRIPMAGCVESLNAAVAAGILLYEIRRQQNSDAD